MIKIETKMIFFYPFPYSIDIIKFIIIHGDDYHDDLANEHDELNKIDRWSFCWLDVQNGQSWNQDVTQVEA